MYVCVCVCVYLARLEITVKAKHAGMITSSL